MSTFEDHLDDGMAPWWLVPVLQGRHDLVDVVGDPFWAVQRRLPGDGVAELGLQGCVRGVPTTYFVVVDALQTDQVLSVHALVWEPDTLAQGAWWTLVDGGWICDQPSIGPSGRLRWLPDDEVAGVTRAVELFYAAARRARRPESVRRRIDAALREQGSHVIDLEPVYVQWAGFPGGLHLEVGDGRPYEEPLDPMLWTDLRWLGWRPPGDGNRNAWFEAVGPDALDVATDLVVRTLAVLDRAEARRRRQRGLELMRGPASSALIEQYGDHLRVDGDAGGV